MLNSRVKVVTRHMPPPPSDDTPDDELLRMIAAGDERAFVLFFRRRRNEVYRFALHMTASKPMSEDVTQEVFMAVMRDAGRYVATRATVMAWLYGITRNFVRRREESDRRLQPLDDESTGIDAVTIATDSDPLGDLARREQIATLRRAVLSLPVRYREVVALCDLEELSYADAAQAIGCTIGTVRSRLHRARTLLAHKLKERAAAGMKVGRGCFA
jgi:RNA polymerase sigma-70 factor (ECF subfamily)